MLYTLNLHNVMCQLYLSKAGGEKKTAWAKHYTLFDNWLKKQSTVLNVKQTIKHLKENIEHFMTWG